MAKLPIEKSFTKFVKLNTQLKNIFSMYYISLDGYIYGKSLLSFSEMIVAPKMDSIDITPFNRAIIEPMHLYDIIKNYKVSKCKFDDSQYDKIIGECDEENTEPMEIKRLITEDTTNDTITKKENIFPNMYKKIDILLKGIEMYHNNEYRIYTLSDDEMFDLMNNTEVVIDYDNIYIITTKGLFPLLNKKSNLHVMYICDGVDPNNELKRRRYVLIHQEEPNIDIYSIMPFMIINK